MRPGDENGLVGSVRQDNDAARDIYAAGRDIKIANHFWAPPGAAVPTQVVTGEIPRQPLGFVARDAQAELSQAAARAEIAVVCAVTGLRGVGKTQLAAAYARSRVLDGWKLVAWVNAENRDTLLAGLARTAERAGVADPLGDSLESARRLKEHLQTRHDESLLVFDNANDPDELRPFLPAMGKTQVVVTTTRREFSELGEPVEVPVFSRPESVAYLSERTGLADPAGASAVAEELGDLPLGLAQAAATIRRQRLTYGKYLERLRMVPVETLLGRVPGADYPRSTAAALLISIDATEGSDPTGLTKRVLRAVAALSPNGVPQDILNGLAGTDGSDLDGALDAAIERCTAGSLLTWSMNGDSVIMHRLLGRVLRDRDQEEGRWHETVTAALQLLEPRFVPAELAWAKREEGEQLAEQVEALWEADLAARSAASDLRVRMLRGRAWAVSQLREAANATGAIARGVQTLSDCKRVLGAEHPQTLSLGITLALAHRNAGQLVEAIAVAEQTLDVCARVLGADHPETLRAENALAASYRTAGRLSEAIALYRRTLASRIRVLGPDHRDTLLSQSSLGMSYRLAGQLSEAIALYEQTLADRRRVLGDDHPATMTTRNTLAGTYQAAERAEEAVALYETTLADRERVLAIDHPQVLRSRHDLAGGYLAVGRLGEAVELYGRVLADRERTLGAGHPATLATRKALAEAQLAAGLS